jgi:hypothetical protein
MNLSYYQFKENPFRITPPINPEEIVWAGRTQLKQKIDHRIKMGIETSQSRIVLNWGRYGSGKTHAANYYSKTSYVQDRFGVKTKNIKINLPRTSKDPVQAFLRALVGQLSFDNIVSDFSELHTIFTESVADIIAVNSNDQVISEFIMRFISPEEEKIKQLNALKHYLYGDNTTTTLNTLGLPLGLEDDEQVVNLISTLFNCITYQKQLYQSVFLWIDEFEDIDTLTRSNQDRLTTFLRQLVDKTPNNLTIFLNFTLKGRGDIEDLSIRLGEALASRAKLFIEFDSPSVTEALDYLKDLINHSLFRSEKDENAPFYPFTEATSKYIIEHLGKLSIRKINEVFSLIIELALIEQDIPEYIDINFVNRIKEEIIFWEE